MEVEDEEIGEVLWCVVTKVQLVSRYDEFSVPKRQRPVDISTRVFVVMPGVDPRGGPTPRGGVSIVKCHFGWVVPNSGFGSR